MQELEIQRSGLTDRKSMIAIVRATNARYVLAGTITRLGKTNLFDAKILNIESGEQTAGKDYEYQNLVDGIELMKQLALDLTGITEEARIQARVTEEKYIANAAQRAEEERIREKKRKIARSKLFSLGTAAGSTFTVPWVVVNIGGTASLLPYTFFDLGLDIGFIHRYEGREDLKYFSLYPYAHLNLYLPLGNIGGLYIGAGAGYMTAFYATGDEKNLFRIPAAEGTAGFYLGSKRRYFKVAWTLRTPTEEFFSVLNHKVTIGYSYRWE
jgi:hypothetical protein